MAAATAAKLFLGRPCFLHASCQGFPPFKPSSIPQHITSPAKIKNLSTHYDALSFRPSTFYGFVAIRRSLCTSPPAHLNESGSIDSPLMQSMENKIKESLHADSVTVKDTYGDGRHVSIEVVSSEFKGVSAVSRQRMVYKAIWEELQHTVHAVDQMSTKTPEEEASSSQ